MTEPRADAGIEEKATDVIWPQDVQDLIEMARGWPLLTDDSGAMLTGDVLIHKLGNALAALAGVPSSPAVTASVVGAICDRLHGRANELDGAAVEIESRPWNTHTKANTSYLLTYFAARLREDARSLAAGASALPAALPPTEPGQ